MWMNPTVVKLVLALSWYLCVEQSTSTLNVVLTKPHQKFGSAGAGASWGALGLKTIGAHSTRDLKLSGCKR